VPHLSNAGHHQPAEIERIGEGLVAAGLVYGSVREWHVTRVTKESHNPKTCKGDDYDHAKNYNDYLEIS
jgi:hypothetical protein